MRKMMTKEVTRTKVKASKIVKGENGEPKLETLPDITLLGNVSMEKAQKEVTKQYGMGVQVFEVIADTEKYEMSVLDFLKHATKIEETEPQTETPANNGVQVNVNGKQAAAK